MFDRKSIITLRLLIRRRRTIGFCTFFHLSRFFLLELLVVLLLVAFDDLSHVQPDEDEVRDVVETEEEENRVIGPLLPLFLALSR